MSIPFIDLKTQYQALKPQIQERINRVLEHGQYIMGHVLPRLHTRGAAIVYVSSVWVILFSWLNAYAVERTALKSANSLIFQTLARR